MSDEQRKTVLPDLSVCQRPLCTLKGPATHELVFGDQILPICEHCAGVALAEGFAAVPGTNAIVMQLLEHPEDDE